MEPCTKLRWVKIYKVENKKETVSWKTNVHTFFFFGSDGV
jgi:hypothetical protein